MSVPFDAPVAQIPLVVRSVRPEDDLSFIADVPGLSQEAAQHRADQRWLLSCDLPNCFVAVDPDDNVCFMTFLLLARDNALIQKRWGDWLPQLAPDEALIEGTYVSSHHRGKGIMTDACCRIADLASSEFGAQFVVGVISEANRPALKSADKAGFNPYARREDRWFLFRRRIRFVPFTRASADPGAPVPNAPR